MLRQFILVLLGKIVGDLPQVEVAVSPSVGGFAIKQLIVFGSHNIELFYHVDQESMLRNGMNHVTEHNL